MARIEVRALRRTASSPQAGPGDDAGLAEAYLEDPLGLLTYASRISWLACTRGVTRAQGAAGGGAAERERA